MISAPLPDVDEQRLVRLRELGILDTLEEEAYDDLTMLAAQICQTPIALVSLVDRDRQWFKSHHGLAARETPRDIAFCAHAILDDKLFVINDSANDVRFRDNPLAVGAPFVKFYAGAPLIFEPGIRLGTLCVIDSRARSLSPEQERALGALARQVVSQLKLRLRIKELQQLDHAKDDFISMVSHELRTPLTAISGAVAILQAQLTEASSPHAANLLAIAHRNSDRLIVLVNDILDAAKLQSGKIELHLESVDAAALATQAGDMNRAYCDTCNCTLAVAIRCAPNTTVRADPQRIQQVLSNLISNAAKFSRKGDTVELAVDGANGEVRFSVTDHGPGIPADAQDRLFKRFSQINAHANEKLPGTGLGLNISKQLVELHGGTIGFESIPEEHTTFYFTLPRARD